VWKDTGVHGKTLNPGILKTQTQINQIRSPDDLRERKIARGGGRGKVERQKINKTRKRYKESTLFLK